MSLALREKSAAALKSAATIRERCRNVADVVTAGKSRYFRIDRRRLDETAAFVASVTRDHITAYGGTSRQVASIARRSSIAHSPGAASLTMHAPESTWP